MKRNLWLILPLFLFGINACSLVEEEDLSDDNVNLLAPADSLVTDILTHTFWWDEVEGASGYELQIVTPDFEHTARLELDSVVETNQFSYTLTPGTYQWRLRAVNANSETPFKTRTLFIDTTSDLNNQTMILIFPPDNHVTKDTSITFKWQTISIADDYRFEIASPDFSVPANTLTSLILTEDSAVFIVSAGDYQWRVRAQNLTSNTLFTTRRLSVDFDAPQTPVLTAPPNNSSSQDSVTLQWQSSSDKLRDSLFIYTDSLFSPPIIKEAVTTNSYIYSGTPRKYYWRVKTVDSVGNESAYSLVFSFTIFL